MTNSKVGRRNLLYGLFLVVSFVTVLLLATANRGTFPFASDDDASFFIPAWNLAVFGNLNPVALNAPDGIYWVPHGFYVWIAFFLRLINTTKGVALAVSAATIATAVVLLLAGLARVAYSRGFTIACAILLVSPPTFFAGNTIRMEGLIVLLYAAAIWLHTCKRYTLALSMLTLSLLVHPALGVSLGLYALSLTALAIRDDSAPARRLTGFAAASNVVVVLSVVLAFAAELVLIASHRQIFHTHMGYQVRRKAAFTVTNALFNRRWLALIAEILIMATLAVAARYAGVGRRFLTEIAPVGLMALGLQTYAAFGREMAYEIYHASIVPVSILCVAYGTTSLILQERKFTVAQNGYAPTPAANGG